MKIHWLLAAGAAACALSAAFPGPAQSQQRPVALQYDEITRFVMAPATPPPPGSFQSSYQQLLADARNSSGSGAPPAQRGGLAGLIQGITGAVTQGVNAMQMVFKDGTLTRKTYYGNWVRTDDPVAKTATIVKCDQYQTIQLDLAKKTYHIVNTRSSPAAACPTPVPMGPARTQVANAAPGTVNVSLASRQSALGAMTLDGIPTTGYSNSTTMAMTNATGSCRNGSFGTDATRYVSNISVPRAHCPLRKVRMPASSPVNMVVRGGCKPRMTAHVSGAYWTHESDTLEMYNLITLRGGGSTTQRGFTTVTQAGNVQWLTKPQADALFSVPADFTQSSS